MSDQTKQALEQFVQKMLAGAEQARNFAVEQSPLLVQEWLAWQMWSSVAVLVVCAVLLPLGVRLAKHFYPTAGPDFDNGISSLMGVVSGVVMVVGGGGFGTVALFTLLKVLVAPRVLILEKFMDLVR